MTLTCDTWWPPDLSALAELRKAVRTAVGPCRGVDADSAELLTTELVTNAVTHGRSPFHLTVDVRADAVRVTVADQDATPPARVRAAPEAESGRGIALVETYSRDWGYRCGPEGKAVWFELPCSAD